MTTADNAAVAKPLARYAPFRRAGDLVFFAGIIAVNPDTGRVIESYADLPEEMRAPAGETGEISVDSQDGPMAAQAWYVMESLRRTVATAGGTLEDVINVTQYFTNLRDFPVYNRVRAEFFVNPPASTCVQVVGLLPTTAARLEVQATAYIPQRDV